VKDRRTWRSFSRTRPSASWSVIWQQIGQSATCSKSSPSTTRSLLRRLHRQLLTGPALPALEALLLSRGRPVRRGAGNLAG
jgi:hypothetical protein